MDDQQPAPGQRLLNDAKDAGYSQDEINDWHADAVSDALKHGYSQQEVNDYFGVKEPDMSATKNLIKQNLANYDASKPNNSIRLYPKAKDITDAFFHGFSNSNIGEAMTGELGDPSIQYDPSRLMNIAGQIGSLAGDLPSMAAGALAAGPGGSFAAPAALRKILMDHYQKGDISSAGDFMDRAMGVGAEAFKGAVTGVATSYAGGLGGAAFKGIAGTATGLAAELAAMTTVSKGMEGQLPNADDFINGGIILGAFHGIGAMGKAPDMSKTVVNKLSDAYAKMGMRPNEVIEKANTDPVFKQEMLTSNPDLPSMPIIDDSPPLKEGQTKPDVGFEKFEYDKANAEHPLMKPFGPVEGADIPEKLLRPPEDASPVKIPEAQEESPELTTARESVRSRLADYPKKAGMSGQEMWNSFYDNVVNGLDPFKRATEMLTGGEKVPAGSDPFKLATTFKNWPGKFKQTLESGTIDFKTLNQNGEGLYSILKDVPDLQRFLDYAVSKRDLEKGAQGIETGANYEAARAIVKADGEAMEPVFRRYVDFQNRLLDYAVDSGIIKSKNAGLMKKMNQDFVPFYLLMEDDPFASSGKGQAGIFKEMTGSDEQILNPVESTIRNTAAIIKRAEKNRVLNSLVALSEKSSDAGQILQKVPSSQRPIEIQVDEIKKWAEGQGLRLNAQDLENMTVFRPDNKILADNEFSVNRADSGKREVYSVKPDLSEAIKALDYQPGMTNIFAKIFFGIPAATQRAGVVLNPDFMVRHFFRSDLLSAMQTKYNQVPFLDSLSSIGNLFSEKGKNDWNEAITSGALHDHFFDIDKIIQENGWKLSRDTGNFLGKTWNALNTPFQVLGAITQVGDNATRVSEFRRGEGVGGTLDQKIDSAVAAQEVTLNYNRMGSLPALKAFSAVVPFFNIRIQGIDRTVRAFSDNPVQMSAKAAAMITVPSVINWYFNHDDPRYKNAPNWQKDLFWVIPTNKWEPAKSDLDYQSRDPELRRVNDQGQQEVNNGLTYRIPKPFEVGVLFGSLPERALSSFKDKNPEAFKDFAKTMFEAVKPNFFPPATLAPLEQYTNHNFFTGNQLIPSNLEKIAPAYQYNNYTSETAKQLGKLVGHIPGAGSLASPIVIDNYVQDWSGTLGKYAVQLTDAALAKAGIGNEGGDKPTKSWADEPFIKAFLMRYPQMRLQNIQDFEDNYNKAQVLTNTFKQEMKKGHIGDAQDLQDPEAMFKLDGMNKAIGNLHKSIQGVTMNPKLSGDDKQQLIDSMYYKMSTIATEGNKSVEQYRKALKAIKEGN